ncbi:hypothetical protein ACGFNU_50040 [Spirillospora sp. NPDC048911]|uniref:hypothetical protein n=1 Tax=Spirillospora sp. NPDC048911 TaxID=3364527 RepID=UPI003712A804
MAAFRAIASYPNVKSTGKVPGGQGLQFPSEYGDTVRMVIDPATSQVRQTNVLVWLDGGEWGTSGTYTLTTEWTNPSLRVRDHDLAAVRTRHFGQGVPACAGSHAAIDWGIGLTAGLYTEPGALPATRTEYFTPRLDWKLDEGVTTADCSFEKVDAGVRTERFSRPGSYARQWNDAPFGPGAGVLDLSAADDTWLDVAMLSTWHADGSGDGMRDTSTLRDASGNVVGTSSIPGSGGPWPSPAPGKHTLGGGRRTFGPLVGSRDPAEHHLGPRRPEPEDHHPSEHPLPDAPRHEQPGRPGVAAADHPHPRSPEGHAVVLGLLRRRQDLAAGRGRPRRNRVLPR